MAAQTRSRCRRPLQLHPRRRRQRDRGARHRHRRLPGDDRVSRSAAERAGARAARSRRRGRARQRLQSRHLAVLQSADGRVFRAQALRLSTRPRRSTASRARRRIRCAPMPAASPRRPRRFRRAAASIRPTSSAGSSAAISRPPFVKNGGRWSPCERASSFTLRARSSAASCARTTRSPSATARSPPRATFADLRDAARDLETRSFPADRLVVPGFINGHSHAYQILLRGWADDLALREVAQRRALPRRPAARRPRTSTGRSCWRSPRCSPPGSPPSPSSSISTARETRTPRRRSARRATTGIRLVLARTWMDADYAPPHFARRIDHGGRTNARTDAASPRCERLRRAALAARRLARR